MRETVGKITGQRAQRLDGVGKVNGAAIYASDVSIPGMLIGRVFRSSRPHAIIARLDVDRARMMPGVRAVLTAQDIPKVLFGPTVRDLTVLAEDRVRFIGQPIALVAAISEEQADNAMAAIEVEYHPLPAIFEPSAALDADAPLIHAQWKDYAALPMLVRDRNESSRATMRFGDIEAAFSAADHVFEHTFSTQVVHAGYTEPRSAVARWDDEQLTVWSNSQVPFELQQTLSEILCLPGSKIRVVVPGIGGGFGGKLRIGMEHFAALLAQKARRPVKVVSTTEEELTAANPRQPAKIWIKSGVSKDGLILAKQARVVIDTGAFAGSGPGVAAVALQILAGPYRVPNYHLESVSVYTNKTPTGSFRAPSGPMGNFALESHMDMVAKGLGLDPLEFRLRNVLRDGDFGPAGEILGSVSIEECLCKAANAIGWNASTSERHRGRGIACGWWMTTGGSSGVFVKITADGRVTLGSGAVEIGTGALTGAAQILAEELGLDLEDITIAEVDTQAVPYDYGAQGSRTMFSVGNACIAAASSLRAQLFEMAARRFGLEPEAFHLIDKHVVSGNHRISIAELARLSHASGGGLIGHGTTNSPPPRYDATRVSGHPLPVWNTPSFHAHAVDLSIDDQTGSIKINKYVVAQDVGYAINPTYVEGQIEGGVSQGLGQALSEEIIYHEGRVLNANLTDYKMPTAKDVPFIESILVERRSTAGPYGAKGVGEPPCIEPPAAIANAIAAATGLRMTMLPITAEKLAIALHEERRVAGRNVSADEEAFQQSNSASKT